VEEFNLIEMTQSPDVQKDLMDMDLGLTEDQIPKLNDLNGKFRDKREPLFKQYRPGTPEHRRGQLDLAKDQKTALKENLEPSQLSRLQQIEIQSQGARAFHESSAVDVLNLTADQTKKIRAIKNE